MTDERAIKDKYIDLFTDFGFKKIFGDKLNKDLMLDFLSELLKKKEGKITNITYLPSEKLDLNESDRKAIYDLYCENEKGEKFIVEVQKAKQDFLKDRSLYYSTFPIREQAKKGDWDYKLKAVYTISLVNFRFEKDENEQDKKIYHHEVVLFDKATKKVFYDKLTYIYLELPKFKKKEDELETKFEKWLYLFKHLHRLERMPKSFQERVFMKLFERAEIAKYTKDEYRAYESSLKNSRDYINTLNYAKKEGVGIGRQEGRQEGIGIGRQEGRREIAKILLSKGVSLDIISESSGLSKEQLEKLKKS